MNKLILIIVSTFVYIVISVIAFIRSKDKSDKKTSSLIFFLFLSVIYGGLIVYEKIETQKTELSLRNQLDVAKQEIVLNQSGTNEIITHTSSAIIDVVYPTIYRNYPGFRQGLMYYWLGNLDDASQLFKWQLKKTPNHIPSIYNLGIISVCQKKYDTAESLFALIPLSKLSKTKRQLVNAWLRTIKNTQIKGYPVVEDPLQWKLLQYP